MSKDSTNERIREILGNSEVKRDACRCPKCGCVAVEIFDLSKPYVASTGIFRCWNPICPVDCFDPTFPEGIK